MWNTLGAKRGILQRPLSSQVCLYWGLILSAFDVSLEATHFEDLIVPIQEPLPSSIIINVLSLLASLTAHSPSSRHTFPLFQ